MPSKDVPSKDVPSKDVPSKDVPSKDVPSKDMLRKRAQYLDRFPATARRAPGTLPRTWAPAHFHQASLVLLRFGKDENAALLCAGFGISRITC